MKINCVDLSERILKIIKIDKDIEDMEYEKTRMNSPILTDYKSIDVLYDVYVETMKELHPNVRIDSNESRSKFLFVILYLFSPSSLSGKRMCNGLRSKLAKTLNCHRTQISHDAKSLMIFYNIYSSFKDDVDILYGRALEKCGKSHF